MKDSDFNAQVLFKDLEATKRRVDKVEETLEGIRQELKAKSIADAQIQQILETMAGTIKIVQSDTREIRNEMMKLVLSAIEATSHNSAAEKKFYRKLLLGAGIVLVTIVLAAFGIDQLVSF